MMNHPRPRLYIGLSLVLLCLLSLASIVTEKVRGSALFVAAPLWQSVKGTKEALVSEKRSHGKTRLTWENHEQLVLENKRLRGEIQEIREMVRREIALLEEMKSQQGDHPAEISLNEVADTIKKRYWHKFNQLLQLKAIPAQIIFRSAAFWDACCWINVGSDTNTVLGMPVIAKDSPVVVGDTIIGVVDEVGAKQARVRLITDSGLVPSVRVLRKLENGEELYLAKGEIHGSTRALWRSHDNLLKGVGFNCDFADDVGGSRDLRTGVEIDKKGSSPIPIIQKGDLLVTTGMDGVFPRDFRVASVTYVYPLKEGDYYYEIDAIPAAGNLNDLSNVFVLPTLGEG